MKIKKGWILFLIIVICVAAGVLSTESIETVLVVVCKTMIQALGSVVELCSWLLTEILSYLK